MLPRPLLLCLVMLLPSAEARTIVLQTTKHLGVADQPEWSIFEGRKIDGTNLVLTFDATSVSGEQTLFIRQDDVKQDWTVTLNDRRLGKLFLMEAPLVHALAIPPGVLKASGNRLEISGRAGDNILINEIWIDEVSKDEALSKAAISISVTNRELGEGVPCRITVVDERGHLAALSNLGATNLATRPGVVYTPNGDARVGLLPGRYTVFATRGPAWSLARRAVTVPQENSVELTIAREVDTSAWISSDTHIHTLSLSKHGDATLHERVITIAAEGLDMPIVTEHNLHADYATAAKEMGVGRYFTSVPGNEVTTRKGHFNIFPVALSAQPPNHTIENWPALFEKIRQTPEVKVAVINHPTDMHSGFVPFAATNLNLVTGRNLRGDFEFAFDAMEVINSGAMNSDWLAPFRAWFALLNRGYRITAIGSSDSHDVSRFIVGQGRTYIRGSSAMPGEINVPGACENLRQGRAVVSLGLFATLEIHDGDAPSVAGSGELFSARREEVNIHVALQSPGWMRATNATIYANGRPIFHRSFTGTSGLAERINFSIRIAKPKHDTQYVLIASGPGVTNLYWALARPYQPSSKIWEPAVIAATNPVWVDADGDGKFTSPREYARRLAALPLQETLAQLAAYDWAVTTQTAELLADRGIDLRSESLSARLTPAVREAFTDYLTAVPAK